jgi:AAA+ superfamily predicted ATPase
MPLLINEADVFVQRRGKDLVQNAVVSIFLRLLEYHRGLIFLTTNRADDIDYAILSRCIAEIGYTTPGKTERKKLWQVLLKEFNVELSKDELDEVVECFPKVSGRDIQNLIRLTSRVCASVGAKFSVSTLKDNAVFRSIEILETNVNR